MAENTLNNMPENAPNNIPSVINEEFYSTNEFHDFIKNVGYSKKLQDFILNSGKVNISFEEKKEIFYEFDSNFDYSKISTITMINVIKSIFNIGNDNTILKYSNIREQLQDTSIDIIRKYINNLFKKSFLDDFNNKLIYINQDMEEKLDSILRN